MLSCCQRSHQTDPALRMSWHSHHPHKADPAWRTLSQAHHCRQLIFRTCLLVSAFRLEWCLRSEHPDFSTGSLRVDQFRSQQLRTLVTLRLPSRRSLGRLACLHYKRRTCPQCSFHQRRRSVSGFPSDQSRRSFPTGTSLEKAGDKKRTCSCRSNRSTKPREGTANDNNSFHDSVR